MAISSRFQPRNLAYRGFNPFFPSGGDYDWGPGVERRVGPLSGGKTEYGSVDQPTESEIQPPGDFVLDTDVVTDVVNDVNNVIPPNTDFTPDPMSGDDSSDDGWDEDFDFDDWWDDYDDDWDDEDIPEGATLYFRKGLLPTGTPTFNIHNPYYGDDYEAERWYSGSYGWRLPGGPHYSAPSGGFNAYTPWGGMDKQYSLGTFGPENEAAWGTNLTPYQERWFSGNTLVPSSYESYIEDITTTPSSNPDIMSTTTGVIPSWVGMMSPGVSSDYHEYQAPKEMTLWGQPRTALSRVSQLAEPSFVHPFYDWAYSGDFS